MPLLTAADTHIGQKRPHNEDAFLVLQPEQTQSSTLPVDYLLLVADGMGGHAKGEVASAFIRDFFQKNLTQDYAKFLDDEKFSEYESLMLKLVQSSHSSLRQLAIEEAGSDDPKAMMGTTLTAAFVTGQDLIIGHVGDSRAYCVHDGQIQQLTHDHTLGRELFKAGKLTAEEAALPMFNNALSQAMGATETITPDVLSHELQADDRILVCSDGLTRYVDKDEILDMLTTLTPDKACQRMIQLANERGGRDNITAIVAHFESPGV